MKNKGFTLLEIIVSVTIIGIVSTVSLANFRYYGQKGGVDMAAQKLASDIRRVQSYAFGLKIFTNAFYDGRPSGGWGIYCNKQGANKYQYIVFADWGDGSGGLPNQKYNDDLGFEEDFQTIYLPKGIKINDLKIDGGFENQLHLTFEPPDPIVYICDNSGPCNKTTTGTTTEIILSDDNDNHQRIIKVNSFGLVDVE